MFNLCTEKISIPGFKPSGKRSDKIWGKRSMNPRSENWRAAGRVSDLIDFCPLGKFFFKDPGIFLDINQLHLFPELSGFGISIICLLSPKSMSRLTPIEYKLADYLFQVFRTRKHSFATTASSAPAQTGSGSTLSIGI